MDTQVLNLIRELDPPTDEVPEPLFVLTQGSKVFGVAKVPTRLPYYELELSKPWKVALGIINEFGQPEIVCMIAAAFPMARTTCRRISSPIDGTDRLIGQTGTMAGVICNRLAVLFNNGCYEDVLNIPPSVIVYDCDSGAKK